MRIGIDLDNTIIYYDDAFTLAAKRRGLLPEYFSGTKQEVRDYIRTLPDGETDWQKLQGYVYGKGLPLASLFTGVDAFFRQAVAHGHECFIVSHKTSYGHYDPERINLRDAALSFLEAHNLFSCGLKQECIFFAGTRVEKVNQIRNLNLDWFIDDLVEVYEEPHFPHNIRKILFHTAPTPAPEGHWQVCNRWEDIVRTLPL